MDTLFRYIGYVSTSLVLGFISTTGEIDYLQSIKPSIIPVLLTLTVLHTTLTGALLNELIKYNKTHINASTSDIIISMRRSALIEITIICTTFAIFTLKSPLIRYINIPSRFANSIENAIIVFAFIYFILVLLDAIQSWFKLMIANNQTDQT